jgi:hypothetical protein
MEIMPTITSTLCRRRRQQQQRRGDTQISDLNSFNGFRLYANLSFFSLFNIFCPT